MPSRDGALGHKGRAVSPVGGVLKEAAVWRMRSFVYWVLEETPTANECLYWCSLTRRSTHREQEAEISSRRVPEQQLEDEDFILLDTTNSVSRDERTRKIGVAWSSPCNNGANEQLE